MPRRWRRFPSAFAKPYDTAAPRHATIPMRDTLLVPVAPRRNKTQTPMKPSAIPKSFLRLSVSSALVKWVARIEKIGVVVKKMEERTIGIIVWTKRVRAEGSRVEEML